ncbi:MAG: exosome protein, partial [Nitrosopumilus sp. BACL13 MAG-120910-bin56]
ILGIKEEEFTSIETTGYFENPIIMLSAKLVKKQGQNFIKKMLELLAINQINELIEEIEERTIDSRFHLRVDKQELVKGKLIISEKDTVKIKIHTPIYNKKDTVKIFTEIFQMVN